SAPVTPVRNRGAGNILERQVRPSLCAEAGIIEPGDVWMRELGEDVALTVEPFGQLTAQQTGVRQLQRHWAFDHAVTAASEPHGTHASAANLLLDYIGTYR